MRLLNFLNKSRSKSLSLKKTKDILNNNCSDAVKSFKKGYKLFRGYYKDHDDYLFLDPKKGKPRKSAYASHNYYTLFIDNLPSWKEYPKRSQSVICSSSYTKASHYSSLSKNSSVYIVFPYNGSKIGVCPHSDIFNSFKIYGAYSFLFNDGDGFNRFLENLFYTEGISNASKNWQRLKDAMKKFDTNYDINDYTVGFTKLLRKWYDGNMLKMWDKLLSPEYNNFRLTTKIDTIPNNRECWTDGKCVLVRLPEIENVLGDEGDVGLKETYADDDYLTNIPIEKIQVPDSIIRNAYFKLTDYITNRQKLPTDISVKAYSNDINNPKRDYIINDEKSALALINNILSNKKKVNIRVNYDYDNPFTWSDIWKYQKNKKYKGLEDFSDEESIEYDIQYAKENGILL